MSSSLENFHLDQEYKSSVEKLNKILNLDLSLYTEEEQSTINDAISDYRLEGLASLVESIQTLEAEIAELENLRSEKRAAQNKEQGDRQRKVPAPSMNDNEYAELKSSLRELTDKQKDMNKNLANMKNSLVSSSSFIDSANLVVYGINQKRTREQYAAAQENNNAGVKNSTHGGGVWGGKKFY